jgi:hypothetical protein
VTREHPGAKAFGEARAIISTVRFSKPVPGAGRTQP